METKITKEIRIIDTNKTSIREIKLLIVFKKKKTKILLKNKYVYSGHDTCSIGGNTWIMESKNGTKVSIKWYHDNGIKENIPIGSALTAIGLPDEETIIAKIKEASMLDKKANTLFSEVQMEDNHVHVKCPDLGKRCSGAEGYIIPVSMKKVTNNMPWYPETKTNNDTTPEKYDNIIEEGRKWSIHKYKENIWSKLRYVVEV